MKLCAPRVTCFYHIYANLRFWLVGLAAFRRGHAASSSRCNKTREKGMAALLLQK